jgi:hypothetical protein
MSPIIELQRRMVEAGRIRAGERGSKGEPRKLDKWRLTSKDRPRLERAAELWGGQVQEWEGQFELYTDTDSLPILVEPGRLPTTWYEMWSKGGCQRRCDGEHEIVSDSSCLCNAEQERTCKPYTRLSVMLPDLPGIGSWLLTSTGWNAASELIGAVDILQRASAQGVLIPARLTLQQRVEVKSGQTRRYAVPVIDIDVSFRELLGGNQGALPSPPAAALPSGYVPLAGNGGNGVSLSEGLTAAETQTVARGARSAAPIPAQDDLDFGGAPLPPDESGAPGPTSGSDAAAGQPDSLPTGAPVKPTKRQTQKLGVLVGRLREAEAITTEHLWSAVANSRNVEVDVMIELLHGRDDEGVLHFGPLLADLNRVEASNLIDRLERLEANVGAAK